LATNKEWTEGRYKSFITSTLRGGFRRYPPKYESLKEAQVGKKINDKSQRLAMHYECAGCKGHFPAKEVQVDHILPVVCPKKGFDVEISEQEEEILLKMIANYVVRNCVLEQTEDGHEIHLHYLPDWIFEGKMQ